MRAQQSMRPCRQTIVKGHGGRARGRTVHSTLSHGEWRGGGGRLAEWAKWTAPIGLFRHRPTLQPRAIHTAALRIKCFEKAYVAATELRRKTDQEWQGTFGSALEGKTSLLEPNRSSIFDGTARHLRPIIARYCQAVPSNQISEFSKRYCIEDCQIYSNDQHYRCRPAHYH